MKGRVNPFTDIIKEKFDSSGDKKLCAAVQNIVTDGDSLTFVLNQENGPFGKEEFINAVSNKHIGSWSIRYVEDDEQSITFWEMGWGDFPKRRVLLAECLRELDVIDERTFKQLMHAVAGTCVEWFRDVYKTQIGQGSAPGQAPVFLTQLEQASRHKLNRPALQEIVEAMVKPEWVATVATKEVTKYYISNAIPTFIKSLENIYNTPREAGYEMARWRNLFYRIGEEVRALRPSSPEDNALGKALMGVAALPPELQDYLIRFIDPCFEQPGVYRQANTFSARFDYRRQHQDEPTWVRKAAHIRKRWAGEEQTLPEVRQRETETPQWAEIARAVQAKNEASLA